ncbi:MAG: four helix bundle protein [Candidatus Omnitrophica bacterium]|nr:four helix bundle protein [Candidatus Omnitrophota bacterium]MBU1933028.1 four helix bundle protein [Candidatus Omnitrophota bacterium]
MKGFKDLKVWQKGIELVREVYKATNSFPKEELYGLSSQIRRAAVSVPSNIAEGFRRRHAKEFKQFLNIALGSCAETETQVIIARELNYIDKNTEEFLMDKTDHISGMIVNLSKKL